MTDVPKSHPRYASLRTRNLIVEGIKKGVTSIHGLIAHGRGEAFDYLLGEKTNDFARKSIEAATAMLLMAKHPVISVNGNTVVLVAKELVELSKISQAPLEGNIFHVSQQRESRIKNHLIKNGAKSILMPDKKYKIKFLDSNRKYVNPHGIYKADVVFVPLEDGDRTEEEIKNGKKVITIDLNPLSRTAQKATITIVDNIVRAMPLLIEKTKEFKKYEKNELEQIIKDYDNKAILNAAIKTTRKLWNIPQNLP